MSSSLQTKFTGDASQLVAAYEQIARENVKLREGARDAANEARAGHDGARTSAEGWGGAIGGVLGQLGGMVTIYGTIKSALDAVNDQIRQQIELQHQAAAAQSAMAMPRASLLQNLGGNVSPAEIKEVQQTIDLASQKGYGSRDVLTAAYGELASATPTMNQKQRQEAFMLAARFAPQPELAGTIASGIGDAMSLTGSDDPEVNLGVIAATARESRSTTPQAVAQFMIPAAAGIKANYGDTDSEAMALVLALQDASKDAEGRTSSTMAIEMAKQAADFTSPERVQELTLRRLQQEKHVGGFGRHDTAFDARVSAFLRKSGDPMGAAMAASPVEDQIQYMEQNRGLQDKFIAAEREHYGSNLKSTHERIALLQQDKQLGEEFLKDLHGEARPLGFAKQLIRNEPGAEVSAIYQKEIAGGIPTGAAAKAEAQRAIANLEADPDIQARRADLSTLNTEGMLLEARKLDAEKARAREARQRLFHATGITGVQGWLGEKEFDANLAMGNVAPAIAARDKIAYRIRTLEDPGHMDSFGGRDERLPGRPATDEELEQASILKGYLSNLEDRIAASQKEAEDKRYAQAERHHQEQMAVARQQGARTQAAVPRGSER